MHSSKKTIKQTKGDERPHIDALRFEFIVQYKLGDRNITLDGGIEIKDRGERSEWTSFPQQTGLVDDVETFLLKSRGFCQDLQSGCRRILIRVLKDVDHLNATEIEKMLESKRDEIDGDTSLRSDISHAIDAIDAWGDHLQGQIPALMHD